MNWNVLQSIFFILSNGQQAQFREEWTRVSQSSPGPRNQNYKCKEEGCECSFSSAEAYHQHDLKQHSKKGQKFFKCPYIGCKRTFARRWNRKQHLNLHLHTRPKEEFVCEECGKVFTMRHRLNAHVVVHSNEKPFRCPMCSKDFKTEEYASRHHRRHFEQKKFVCNKCDKVCTNQGNISQHCKVNKCGRILVGGKMRIDSSTPCLFSTLE